MRDSCKIRIASNTGQGKSGGARSIITFKSSDRIFWLHLFTKNTKSNVTKKELSKLKKLADIYLSLSKAEVDSLIKLGELKEVAGNV